MAWDWVPPRVPADAQVPCLRPMAYSPEQVAGAVMCSSSKSLARSSSLVGEPPMALTTADAGQRSSRDAGTVRVGFGVGETTLSFLAPSQLIYVEFEYHH